MSSPDALRIYQELQSDVDALAAALPTPSLALGWAGDLAELPTPTSPNDSNEKLLSILSEARTSRPQLASEHAYNTMPWESEVAVKPIEEDL